MHSKNIISFFILLECTIYYANMHEIHAKNGNNNATDGLPRRNFKIERQSDKDKIFKVTKFAADNASTVTRERTTFRFTDVPSLEPLLSPFSIKYLMTKIAKKKDNYANTTIEVIGRTVQYNDIVLAKMTEPRELRKKFFRTDENKFSKEPGDKKVIFIIHGLDSKNIESVPGLYKQSEFEELLGIYMKHLDKFDIYFIPVANPDGLATMLKTKLSWGKNASPQDTCPGVYLDRNFNVAWNQSLQVASCHPKYPGPAAFSERESQAILSVLHQYNHKIAAFINVHANPFKELMKGEAVLFPRGFTDVSNDDDKYYDMKGEIEEALKNVTMKSLPFEMTSLYNWHGKISGSSVDYAAEVYGIPYSLEFVMQPFNIAFNKFVYTKYVLKEIWGTIIDVIFNHIHKNINEV